MGGFWSGKSTKHYLRSKLMQKGLEAWLKWLSTCLTSTRLSSKPKYFKKKKKRRRKRKKNGLSPNVRKEYFFKKTKDKRAGRVA
jgi:hypothetical protein